MTPTADDIRALHAQGVTLNECCARLKIGWHTLKKLMGTPVKPIKPEPVVMPKWPKVGWELRRDEIRSKAAQKRNMR